jgi:WD40 repeat protein
MDVIGDFLHKTRMDKLFISLYERVHRCDEYFREQLRPVLFILFAHLYTQLLDEKWSFFNRYHMGTSLGDVERYCNQRVHITLSRLSKILLSIHLLKGENPLKELMNEWIIFHEEEIQVTTWWERIRMNGVEYAEVRWQVPAKSSFYTKYLEKTKDPIVVPEILLEDVPKIAHVQILSSSSSLLCMDMDPETIVAGFEDVPVRVWRKGGKEKELSSFPCYAISLYRNHVLTTTTDQGIIQVWDIEGDEDVVPCVFRQEMRYPIWTLEFAPRGYYFVTGGRTGLIHLWQMDQVTTPKRTLNGHVSDVQIVTWHPNTHYIASTSLDHTCYLWDIQSCTIARHFSGFSIQLTSLRISPDGKRIAGGTLHGKVHVWDLPTGKECLAPSSSSSSLPVYALTWQDEHTLLATDEEEHLRFILGGEEEKVTVPFRPLFLFTMGKQGRVVVGG